ncbi:MAG: UDP-N-acetylmuramoyl-tripeptide--D-alanyl-D-alanine ligase [Heliobacteriaceae bacterium]|jgi:UDP-N-acetylmuramoyl-tripeptide--D-alanyl-D-alanine ligase|nr:UDP-N-acetylmuramoyl-tripeptide--D-alanyl-D-alanine ligase [Heliobacteriaceae bacterium]
MELNEIVDKFNISTDTRTIKKGDLYLPLKGANFDGEDFLQSALEAGAAGFFTVKDDYPAAEFVFRVENTLQTYLELAKIRKEKIAPLTIAVTGSSGKTTTKEMIAAVVSRKFKTHKTFSNHNNEIGFCRTVFSMPADTEALITEMGMRGPGEIELLSKYAEPDFTVITNTGSAHIGRLGSLDNIAKAKCEIVKYQKKTGTLIAHDDERIKKYADFAGEKIFYSLAQARILKQKPGYSEFLYKGKSYELNAAGDYNIENSLAAIETGEKFGMSYEEIRAGLLAYKPVEKRWETEKAGRFTIINDSYNANPDSMKAAVSAFLSLYKNPVVVLGDMGELGNEEAALHKDVGKYLDEKLKAAEQKPSAVLTVGALAKHIGDGISACEVKRFNTNLEVSRYILANFNESNTIFLKASRAMKFEEIIYELRRAGR